MQGQAPDSGSTRTYTGGRLPPEGETVDSGYWVYSYCPDGARWTWVPNGEGAPALPSPEELLQQARDSIVVTTPEVTVNPYWTMSDGRSTTLVNLPTWFWVDGAGWEPQEKRVEVGPVWVVLEVKPSTLAIDPGDGAGGFTCAGPGTPYDSSYGNGPSPDGCSYAYPSSSGGGSFTVTVTAGWKAVWYGSDGTNPVGGEFDLTAQPQAVAVAVSQAQSQLEAPGRT